MKMYCPRCGTADQEPESYCRSCGDFLLDYSGRSILISRLFGGSAPSTQINVNLILNLITILTSFLLLGFLHGHYDALRARTGETEPSVIYLVYAFLIAISFWQLFSIVIGLRLRAKLGGKKTEVRKTGGIVTEGRLTGKQTQELLPKAVDYDTVPLIAADDPTRILQDLKRK